MKLFLLRDFSLTTNCKSDHYYKKNLNNKLGEKYNKYRKSHSNGVKIDPVNAINISVSFFSSERHPQGMAELLAMIGDPRPPHFHFTSAVHH